MAKACQVLYIRLFHHKGSKEQRYEHKGEIDTNQPKADIQ